MSEYDKTNWVDVAKGLPVVDLGRLPSPEPLTGLPGVQPSAPPPPPPPSKD